MMRPLLRFVAFGALACATAFGSQDAVRDRPEETLTAFVGVNVIPMDRERVLKDQTVLVRGERIESIGPASRVKFPKRARVIDGRGKYLAPGLAEMHGHVPPPNAPEQHVEDVLFLYVASGITTVRGMLGAPGQLELKERSLRGELIAPNLYLAGPSFHGQSVDSPEHAVRKVREQKAEGWDLLKVHPGLTRDEYDAMAKTAREVGIRFGGHVPSEVGLGHALEMGQETFDHIDGYVEHLDGAAKAVDERELEAIVARTRKAGAWIVPTMALWETLYGVADLETLTSYRELRYMPPRMVRQWTETHRNRLANPELDTEAGRRVIENRTRILRALHQGGVRILMGTDAPQQFSVPGFALHREFPRMAAAGMSPWDILVSGTRNVGLYFANEDEFGTVEAGNRADLILLEENPLEDSANLQELAGVMVRGRWLPKSEIDRRLAEIAKRNAGEQAPAGE